MKEKAARNKTIDFPIEEGREYLDRCIGINDITEAVESIMNQFIIGDCIQVMERLPKKFVDLLVVDPPYNLAKDYHGNKFNRKSQDDYREYTILWLEKVLPLLKDTASIYVCCDWKSSLVIGDVLHNYFKVQNRITWQR